jgi:group I intron endonuclease
MSDNTVYEAEHCVNTISGVYFLECITESRYYIGSSVDIEKRWKEHVRELNAQRHHSIELQKVWNEYGQEDFCFGILAIVSDETDRLMTEQIWIDFTDATNPIFGLNRSANAADAIAGVPRTQEHNDKIGRAHLGMKRSLEARMNMSAASRLGPNPERMRALNLSRRGQPLSEEHRNKLSGIHKGRPKSEAHRKAMSEAQLRRWGTTKVEGIAFDLGED